MVNQFWLYGEEFELYSNQNIQHTFQVNDIAEVKDRQASHTNQISAPKTPKNIRIVQGLGITSDTSIVPYDRIPAQFKIDGFDLIVKGWANITETADDFKIHIYSGIIEFFKSISNKSLADLDLSDIEHDKTLANVVASFTNPSYRYFIADYNGKTHYGPSGERINIDFLNPSVNIHYLWNKIFMNHGFTYEGSVFSEEKFTNWWMTYPKATKADEVMVKIAEYEYNKSEARYNTFNYPDDQYHFLVVSSTIQQDAGQLVQYGPNFSTLLPQKAGHFIFPESNYYRIEISGTVNTKKFILNALKYLSLIRNSQGSSPNNVISNYKVQQWMDISDSVNVNYTITDYFNAGESIALGFFHKVGDTSYDANVNLKIFRNTTEKIQFGNELSDFPITDFVKDVMNNLGITPFAEEFSNKIKFLTTAERFETAPVIDWSDKYIERTGEAYVDSTYGQKNVFYYQYNDKEASHNDGSFVIDNKNLPETKDLFKSKTYSPDKDITTFYINSANTRYSPVFRIWDKEPNDDGTIKYKGLSKRYYYIRGENILGSTIVGSAILNEHQTVGSVPFGSFSELDFKTVITNNYMPLVKVVSDSRIHKINLNLQLMDILTLNMSALYYFKQEQQYYFLNKLQFSEQKAPGEFVRVIRTAPVEIPPVTEKNISILYNSTVTYSSNADYIFKDTDFFISQYWSKVKILTIPDKGVVLNSGVPVAFNDEINTADVVSGVLRFKAEGTSDNQFIGNYTTSFTIKGIDGIGGEGLVFTVNINAKDIHLILMETLCFHHINYGPLAVENGISYPGQVVYIDENGDEQTAFINVDDGIVQITAQSIVYTSGVSQASCV